MPKGKLALNAMPILFIRIRTAIHRLIHQFSLPILVEAGSVVVDDLVVHVVLVVPVALAVPVALVVVAFAEDSVVVVTLAVA
ncbi:hypothetical protein G6F64_014624 [Rhizopus arrhizus]|uniref:Uncharacterized protein n=1 Tax=Rhizopus oryzae TaxID=64495 RepID=A0A9P6WTK6_RHIOR|nr:hypothetical protein G6F64_014624 [Rhizopus arrhizus]